MKTTIYYQFKQWFDVPNHVKALGNTVALCTMTFPTEQEALDFLQEEIEQMHIHEEDVQDWELVRVIQDVVPNVIGKFTKE